jgi:hypothetical protein
MRREASIVVDTASGEVHDEASGDSLGVVCEVLGVRDATIVLSVGRDRQLLRGDAFVVLRDGIQIAEGVVMSVSDTRATGHVMATTAAPRVGDTVRVD